MNVNDKVVCVDVSPCHACNGKLPLTLNQIYVVCGMRLISGGHVVVDLIGVTPECHVMKSNQGLDPSRFRLLDEMKQEAKVKQSKTSTNK